MARDANGIVHIFAANETDMALAQGWAHARDRLFQMDLFRRQASGTLTELFGVGQDGAILAGDIEMRTLGLRRAAACSLGLQQECPYAATRGLSEATRGALEAYAKGVNAFVQSGAGLPPEYASLGVGFGEWSALDSVTVAKGLAFELSFDLDDLQNTEALIAYTTAGSAEGFDGEALFSQDLFRSAPFDPVAVIRSEAVAATAGTVTQVEATKRRQLGAAVRGKAAESEVAHRYLERVRNVPMLKKAFNSARLARGSNAWAVSGAKTSGGRPLLANDPHLDLTTPTLFYPIHLSAVPSRIDAVGDGVAGLPYLLSGTNYRVACGITALPLDVTDFYKEQVLPDPDSPSGLRISHLPPDDASDRLIPIEEVYRDQSGAQVGTTTTLVVPRRNHGPLLSASLSVQYTGFGATRELDALRALMKARSLEDVAGALQFFDVGSQSFTCADAAGKIGYFAAGEVPLRADLQAGTVNGLPPFFLRDGTGANGSNDWLEIPNVPADQALPYRILPYSEMPQVIDPHEGFLVSANNDPLGLNFDNDSMNTLRPGGGIYYLSPRYNPGIRASRIEHLLKHRLEAGPVDFEDMREIQADVVLHDAEFFLPFIIAAYDDALDRDYVPLAALAQDPGVAEAVDRLRDWDGSTPTGVEEGYDARPDGDGGSVSSQEASVAATIYSVWRGQFVRATVIRTLDRITLPNGETLANFDPSSQQLLTAVQNLLEHPEREGVGASGLNFFKLPDALPVVEDAAIRRDYLILASLRSALDLLQSDEFAPAFHGSSDQADYHWGKVHRLVIGHPLGDVLGLTGDRGDNPFGPPFEDLAGLPVDGGLETVDAASHSSKADTLEDFEFSQGPLRRFVTSLGGLRRTESSLPGGVSENLDSPYFDNLFGPWLTNETFRWHRLPLYALSAGDVVILTPRRSSPR